jgi:hypothetical protein
MEELAAAAGGCGLQRVEPVKAQRWHGCTEEGSSGTAEQRSGGAAAQQLKEKVPPARWQSNGAAVDGQRRAVAVRLERRGVGKG